MCQIQFIGKLDGKNLSSKDLREFVKIMYIGNVDNSDAFGLFNDKYMFKQSYDFDYTKINDKKILRSKFLVGHNRFATVSDGFSEPIYNPWGIIKDILKPKRMNHNNHPFELDDLIMVHNGMIYNDRQIKKRYSVKTNIRTDSYTILYLINRFFKNSKKGSRLDKLKDAIQRTTPKLIGYYSIFLYDKVSGNLLYFKKDASFYFTIVDGNTLVGSTNNKNLDYVYVDKKKKDIDIENNKIYLVVPSKNPVRLIGEFTPNKKPRFNLFSEKNTQKNIFYVYTDERGWLMNEFSS